MRLGWETSKLADVLAVLRNGLNCKQDKSGAGDKISRIESISDAHFDLQKVGYATLNDRQKERYRLQPGDILFSHINSVVHVGKTAVFDSNDSVYHGVNLLLMRPKEFVTPAYLGHALKFLFQSGYWRGVCKQSVNQASVNQQDISRVEISYPKSLREQRRIVAILDEAFEGIAKAKANAEKNLQNARAAFMAERFSLFASLRGGKTVTVDQISSNLDSKRVPITKSDRVAGPYPYYGASGIVDHVRDYIFEGDCLLVSEDGANLLARSTPIAFSVSGKYWVNNHAHILRFDSLTTQHFVEHFFESIPIDEYVRGAAQPKLTQSALNTIPIPFPDKDLQGRIVDKIHRVGSSTLELSDLYERKLLAIEALRASLLHQAFAGAL